MGKKIITIDLHPLSRTSLCSDISIVDNVVRAMPQLINEIKKFKAKNIEEDLVFDNNENIKKSIEIMRDNLLHWKEKINER
jgi:4-phosphopantoate--beta-alanine ligase